MLIPLIFVHPLRQRGSDPSVHGSIHLLDRSISWINSINSWSIDQPISVDAVPNRMDGESSTGRHVSRSSSRVWGGLGGRRSHWNSAHPPSSGMRRHLVQPCRAPSTGTPRNGTTHWRGQGSELDRRYLPLRAHRIFQQELSPTDQELPQLFQRSLPRCHSS